MQGMETVKEEGLLPLQFNKYQANNNVYIELLRAMEERLHKILNRQSPEKMTQSDTPSPNDFISAMDAESNKFLESNRRLERLLSHLNEIV